MPIYDIRKVDGLYHKRAKTLNWAVCVLCALCGLMPSLLCVSCTRASSWSLEHVKTGNPLYNSSKLRCPTSDLTNGIDVEILKTDTTEHVYLSVHSQMIPPYKNDPKKAWVHLVTSQEEYTFEALRHEGGQRLLLSKEQADLLLSLLAKKTPLTIELQGYTAQISTKDFSKKFDKMHNTKPLPDLFHLPF